MSLSNSSSQTSDERIDAINNWLKKYWAALAFFRGIELDKDTKLRHLEELIHDNISDDQMNTAAKWLKLGDWTFKSKESKFSYQDFFPTKAQLESIRDGYVLLSQNELALKIRSEKDSAVLLSRSQNLLPPPPVDLEKQKENIDTLKKWLSSDIPSLRSKISTLESKLDKAKSERVAFERAWQLEKAKNNELEVKLKMAGSISVLSEKQVRFIEYLDSKNKSKDLPLFNDFSKRMILSYGGYRAK